MTLEQFRPLARLTHEQLVEHVAHVIEGSLSAGHEQESSVASSSYARSPHVQPVRIEPYPRRRRPPVQRDEVEPQKAPADVSRIVVREPRYCDFIVDSDEVGESAESA